MFIRVYCYISTFRPFPGFLKERRACVHFCSVKAWFCSLVSVLRASSSPNNSVVNKSKMTQDLICSCEVGSQEKKWEFGGNFTPLQLQDQLMGLICIQCGTCKAAAKSASKANFQSLQEFLHSNENSKISGASHWAVALTENDKLRQQILNFAVYR